MVLDDDKRFLYRNEQEKFDSFETRDIPILPLNQPDLYPAGDLPFFHPPQNNHRYGENKPMEFCEIHSKEYAKRLYPPAEFKNY